MNVLFLKNLHYDSNTHNLLFHLLILKTKYTLVVYVCTYQ